MILIPVITAITMLFGAFIVIFALTLLFMLFMVMPALSIDAVQAGDSFGWIGVIAWLWLIGFSFYLNFRDT